MLPSLLRSLTMLSIPGWSPWGVLATLLNKNDVGLSMGKAGLKPVSNMMPNVDLRIYMQSPNNNPTPWSLSHFSSSTFFLISPILGFYLAPQHRLNVY